MGKEMPSGCRLDGQIAVVTGAAQGLGLGIATQLAQDGATVVLSDVQLEKTQAAAARLTKQGFKVDAAYLDVSDSSGVAAFFDRVVQEHGRLDILVCNAGVNQAVAPIVELSDPEWQRVLDVSLDGIFYCCRAAGRIMERQEAGCIVNISSINGRHPPALVVAYNVAKAGTIALTKTLALEMAPCGVRVNAVCPGPVYTELNERVMAGRAQSLGVSQDQIVERIRASIPLGRWGEPEDVAGMVAFLCSPRASWITGEEFIVSGGLEGLAVSPPKRPRDNQQAESTKAD